jgi:hypothetical protein
MKQKAVDALLVAAAMLFGVALGAGVNETLFVMPGWFEAPPESLKSIRARAPTAMKFWIPLQGALALTLVASLALGWKDSMRRGLLGGALGMYGAVWIATAAYFAPEIISLAEAAQRGGDATVLLERGRRWLSLTWGRHSALALGWVLVMRALYSAGNRSAAALAYSPR